MGHVSIRWAAALASAVTVLAVAPSAQATPAARNSPARGAVPAARAAGPAVSGGHHPSGTGASDVSDLGARGWQVQSSAVAGQSGAQISSPGFTPRGWLPVANDAAGAPGTEVEALAQNGRCPGDTALQPVNQRDSGRHSVFFGDNIKRCYGFQPSPGAEKVARFAVPWWWRTGFQPHLRHGQAATLIINGVIGSASVWVNGHRVATSSTVTGAYPRTSIDITGLVRHGRNALAIEVNPNDPNKMFTLDDVDWNQVPPDNNTGLEFPVQLAVDAALSDGNAHVTEHNAADLSRSALTVFADVTNHTATTQSGTAAATVTTPGGRTKITLRQRVTVPAGKTRTVTFAPSRFPALTLTRPRIWWPYEMGGQPLYTLATSVAQRGHVLNSTSETFGIRTVTSYLTGKSPAEPAGTRAFKINGVPLVIRGGGFSPNLFLHYSSADIGHQIALMKNMGLNTIRLEGHIMPPGFFQQMDRAGILINAGYQCCDAWELQGSGLTSPADYRVMAGSALAIGQELRNHPSVFSFQWSDQPPLPKQESVTLAALAKAGFQQPVISSAEYNTSKKLGVSGEKEGPYDWVPPDYWYDTAHFDRHDSSQTNAGGAWGYDSEQSAGDTIPTLDSLHRFMSAGDLSNLWRKPGANQYHANYETQCQVGYSFGTLCHFDTALKQRYGSWHSLAGYVEQAQALDYEDTRAQFEAYLDHSTRRPLPSTGTTYWQMNKGWPSLLWNLYGSDGDQAGSYFGAQEANRPVHAIYALAGGTVTLDNLTGRRLTGLSVESRVYRLGGKLLDDRAAHGIRLASQQVRNRVLTPKVPAVTKPGSPAHVYFVELMVRHHGTLADRNVYWLSTQHDQVNWRKSLGQPVGVISQYANLRGLQRLRRASVAATATTRRGHGPGHADRVTTVTITNTSRSAVAFLLRADVRRGSRDGRPLPGGNEVQSALWRGNDVTLFPGQSQTLTVTYRSAGLHGATPVISVSGWNVPVMHIAAPLRHR